MSRGAGIIIFGAIILISILVILRMARGPLVDVTLPTIPEPPIVQYESLEPDVFAATNKQFGRLAVVDGYPFQCIKLRKDGSYIDYYQPYIAYMGPLEYGKPEWDSLSIKTKMQALTACGEE